MGKAVGTVGSVGHCPLSRQSKSGFKITFAKMLPQLVEFDAPIAIQINGIEDAVEFMSRGIIESSERLETPAELGFRHSAGIVRVKLFEVAHDPINVSSQVVLRKPPHEEREVNASGTIVL